MLQWNVISKSDEKHVYLIIIDVGIIIIKSINVFFYNFLFKTLIEQ